MSDFSNYLENAVLNHVFRNTPMASPAQTYLALYTVAPTEAGGGTEVSGAGYARKPITFGAPADGVIKNTSAVTFTASGGNYGNVVAAGVFDAATGGNFLGWKDIVPAVTNDGDSVNFAADDITISQD